LSPTFADLGIPAAMVASLAQRGLDQPFPIQAATIPDALAGRDLCGRAPTGSGKTIAFGIPLVLGVDKASPRKPRGLVLVPTRELAKQVAHELELLAAPRGPWVEAVYGGVGFERQTRALHRGAEILVACPGRLADLISQRHCDLSAVQFVVLDEADRMADMGFLPEVRRLLDQCPTDRQTLLFSATLDGDVDVLVSKYQRNPARHELAADDHDRGPVEHLFWTVGRTDRLSTAAAAVDRLGPTVVFCRTRRGADRIARNLNGLGLRAAAIHGDRSQAQREQALASFHTGDVQALVATDVAARGIHVEGVAGVVHYDPPADAKDYVHRSGRTARAGATGVVVSLVLPELRRPVEALQKELGLPIGVEPVDLDALGTGSPAPRSEARQRPSDQRSRTADRPRPKHDRSKPDRAHTDRPEQDRSTTDRSTTDRPRTERPRTDRPSTGRPRTEGTRPDHARSGSSKVERVNDLAPLAPGQRRPSGAARRKAKRLAAAEAERLGVERDTTTWAPDDPRRGPSKRRGSSTRAAGADNRGGSGRGSGRPSGASSGRSSNGAGRAAGARSTGSRSAGSRSSSGSGGGSGRSGRAGAAPRASRSTSGRGRPAR
jgi:superfamily II DNA/RNA helicase